MADRVFALGERLEAGSYYRLAAPEISSHEPFGEEMADVVVIGGGYTGLWTALECAARGLSVSLLEARTIGFGASGRNGGQAIPGWRKGIIELSAMFGPERARALFSLAMTARKAVLSLVAEEGIDCELVQGGHLLAAARPRDLEPLAREVEALSEIAGYREAQLLTAAEARERVASESCFGGLLDPGGFQLHPLRFALGLARVAEARGVRIHPFSPVRRIRTDQSVVRVWSDGGEVVARHAVLACDALPGGPAPDLASAVMPVAAYQIATEPLEHPERLISGGLCVSDTRFAVNYYRISADGRLIFGGGERYTERPPQRMDDFVRPYLEGVFPEMKGVRIDHSWGGLVSITRSRLPDIGRKDRLFYAQGFSGQGVLLTALAGRAIAEHLNGHPEMLSQLEGLSPRRFPGGALLRGPLYTAGMLYHALLDRL